MTIIQHERRDEPESLASARAMIVEALCVHECLCRLGFKPTEIRVQLGHTSTPTLALFPDRTKLYDVCIHVGILVGLKSWRLCVGPAYVDGILFEKEFRKHAKEFPLMGPIESEAIFRNSRARSGMVDYILGIKSKGIEIPAEHAT